MDDRPWTAGMSGQIVGAKYIVTNVFMDNILEKVTVLDRCHSQQQQGGAT
jgi:hypothetical protein